MKITWGTILEQVQRLGHLSDAEFARPDYKANCVTFANNALLDLASTNAKQYKSISFVQNKIENLTLCVKDQIYTHIKEDIIFESNNSAVSYYFECDGTATVYIDKKTKTETEVSDAGVDTDMIKYEIRTVNNVKKIYKIEYTWVNISQIPTYSNNSFRYYRGFIGALESNVVKVRIRFSGSYSYNVKNVAVYNVKRSDLVSDIPQYGTMCEYDISAMTNSSDSANFIAFTETNVVKHNGNYIPESDYVIVNEHTIAVPHDAEGEFTVYYMAYPAQISDSIAVSEVVDIDPQFAALIPLYIASNIYADDDISLASTCYNKYVSLKSQLYNTPHNTSEWKQFYNYGRI